MKKPPSDFAENNNVGQSYEKILIALQGLYIDSAKTADVMQDVNAQLHDVLRLLTVMAQHHQAVAKFEQQFFSKPSP